LLCGIKTKISRYVLASVCPFGVRRLSHLGYMATDQQEDKSGRGSQMRVLPEQSNASPSSLLQTARVIGRGYVTSDRAMRHMPQDCSFRRAWQGARSSRESPSFGSAACLAPNAASRSFWRSYAQLIRGSLTLVLQLADDARQTVDKILHPTIFTRNSLCDHLQLFIVGQWDW
jgi:hypothetical protein